MSPHVTLTAGQTTNLLLGDEPDNRTVKYVPVTFFVCEERSQLRTHFYRKEELAGKLVYDQHAMKVGTVKDVGYSKDGQAALILESGGEERDIPFVMIQEIGEIVLLKPEATEPHAPPSPAPVRAPTPPPAPQPPPAQAFRPTGTTRICPKCGKENPQTAKFCGKCGERF